MQQFIPFEDDWDAFEQFCSGRWVPYQAGFISERVPATASCHIVKNVSLPLPTEVARRYDSHPFDETLCREGSSDVRSTKLS